MERRNKRRGNKKLEEQVVQAFVRRCPYCEQTVSYDQLELQLGDNDIQCPWCKKFYVKVVSGPVSEKKKRSK